MISHGLAAQGLSEACLIIPPRQVREARPYRMRRHTWSLLIPSVSAVPRVLRHSSLLTCHPSPWLLRPSWGKHSRIYEGPIVSTWPYQRENGLHVERPMTALPPNPHVGSFLPPPKRSEKDQEILIIEEEVIQIGRDGKERCIVLPLSCMAHSIFPGSGCLLRRRHATGITTYDSHDNVLQPRQHATMTDRIGQSIPLRNIYRPRQPRRLPPVSLYLPPHDNTRQQTTTTDRSDRPLEHPMRHVHPLPTVSLPTLPPPPPAARLPSRYTHTTDHPSQTTKGTTHHRRQRQTM